MRATNFFAVLLFGACVSATGPALAQQAAREVSLVRQDFSDCSNADVKDQDPALVGGTASVTRGADGTTRVSVRLTGRPNTTYHFFLKCVRQLGDITTQGDGSAAATFDFPTDSAGDVFAFDLYPEGAPPGDKFQSVQVNFRDPPPPPPPVIAQLDSREVSLVRQDFSDCSNADVTDQDPSLVGGTTSVVRWSDGMTRVSVRLTGRPDTTYHFFLKCVRLLVDITTQGDGSAAANLEFQTNSAGDVFAFDMYPEGAPLGDKFQSVQVNFRDPLPPPPPPPPPPPVEVSPRVLYLSQTLTGIIIAYADMPAGTEIVLANGTSGDETTSRIAIREGAAESIDFAIDPNQDPGLYYLLARNQSDKRYIAQTVAFYIN